MPVDLRSDGSGVGLASLAGSFAAGWPGCGDGGVGGFGGGGVGGLGGSGPAGFGPGGVGSWGGDAIGAEGSGDGVGAVGVGAVDVGGAGDFVGGFAGGLLGGFVRGFFGALVGGFVGGFFARGSFADDGSGGGADTRALDAGFEGRFERRGGAFDGVGACRSSGSPSPSWVFPPRASLGGGGGFESLAIGREKRARRRPTKRRRTVRGV